MTSSSLSFHDALPQIGHGLPAASLVEELLGLPHRLRAVVESPPGTGKTTIIPPLLAARAEHREPGLKVVVTQPRRVAARAAARRLAQLTRTTVGDHIGYTVRGDAKVSAQTQIEFVTVGVLLRRLLRDPDLDDVSAVVIDEIHERSVETDLTAAFIRDLLPRRDDLELVAMSATAQSQQWVNYFDAALFTAHTDIYALTEEFSKPPPRWTTVASLQIFSPTLRRRRPRPVPAPRETFWSFCPVSPRSARYNASFLKPSC